MINRKRDLWLALVLYSRYQSELSRQPTNTSTKLYYKVCARNNKAALTKAKPYSIVV